MAQATDQQMQTFANERVRVRAQQCRLLVNALEDDQVAIPDIWDRAANGSAWNDDRPDGPPSLLTSADILAYNLVSAILLKCVNGTATSQDVAALASNWPVFMSACVRPIEG